MFFKRLVVIAAFSVPATASVLAAGPGGLPAIDVRKGCEASEKSLVQIFGKENRITVDSCLKQEQGARQTSLIIGPRTWRLTGSGAWIPKSTCPAMSSGSHAWKCTGMSDS
jgi:hypothetical protein